MSKEGQVDKEQADKLVYLDDRKCQYVNLNYGKKKGKIKHQVEEVA